MKRSRKTSQASRRSKFVIPRGYMQFAVAVVVVVSVLGLLIARFRAAVWFPPRPDAVAVQLSQGYVRIPLPQLASHDVQFCMVADDSGVPLRFLVYQDMAGEYHAALDGNVCCHWAGEGYAQYGRDLVCRRCGSGCTTPMDRIESRNCSPVRLPFSLQNEQLLISVNDLRKHRRKVLASEYAPLLTNDNVEQSARHSEAHGNHR